MLPGGGGVADCPAPSFRGVFCLVGGSFMRISLPPKQEHAHVFLVPLPEIPTTIELDHDTVIFEPCRERPRHWSCPFGSEGLQGKRSGVPVLTACSCLTRGFVWLGGCIEPGHRDADRIVQRLFRAQWSVRCSRADTLLCQSGDDAASAWPRARSRDGLPGKTGAWD